MLWIYLSLSEIAVSSTLVRQEQDKKYPVYYISYILKSPEVRYIGLENITLELILIARRLHPYFLSHPVIVLTDTPLGRILTHPEAMGRLIKWATKLNEYNIEYQPHPSIKTQAHADFLVEYVWKKEHDPWIVYANGSSKKEGSGAWVILIFPQGEEIKLVMRLHFKASNNQAKYKALLMTLQVADMWEPSG